MFYAQFEDLCAAQSVATKDLNKLRVEISDILKALSVNAMQKREEHCLRTMFEATAPRRPARVFHRRCAHSNEYDHVARNDRRRSAVYILSDANLYFLLRLRKCIAE
jgi:hypothetical protein